MAKKKRSVRSHKKPVPPPVVLYVPEVEGWDYEKGTYWKPLTMVRPSSDLAKVKSDLLKYGSKRERWMRANYGVHYRIRVYARVEGEVVENAKLLEEAQKAEQAQKAEEVPA